MAFLKELNFKNYIDIIYLVTNIFSLTVLERIATPDEMSIFGIKVRTLGRSENLEGGIQGLLKVKGLLLFLPECTGGWGQLYPSSPSLAPTALKDK